MKSASASSPSAAIADQEVRNALAAIVVSPAFRASSQLASFLRFVVESTLDGRSDRIKGYTIAVEALGRDEKFDPQSDPIVRVEAGRLRRALDRYYEGPGKNDPIIIALPRGSYVPTIRRREIAPQVVRPLRKLRALLAAADLRLVGTVVPAAVVLGIFVHAGINWLSTDSRPHAHGSPTITYATTATTATTRPQRRLYVGPSVLIERVRTTGELAPPTVSAASIETALRDAFARFDDVTIISNGSPSEDRSVDANPTRGSPQPVDYRLTTDIEYRPDSTVTFRFQLIDETDGSIIWSRTADQVKVAADPSVTETAMVRDVAATLLQQYGVIFTRERKKNATEHDRDPHFTCLLDAIDYFRAYDHSRYWPIRSCLERSVAEDPTFASGFAALARLFRREYLFTLDPDPETPPLDRALDMAHRAIELNPNHVRAHTALLDIHMARGEIAEAMAAGEKAIELNPFDTVAQFRYGAQLTLLGDVDRGVKILNEAAVYLPAIPPRYHAVLAIAAYLKNDTASAAAHANQITSDKTQIGLVARILAAYKTRDRTRSQFAISRLVALQPRWKTDVSDELKKYFHVPWIVERIANDLTAAGLTASSSRPSPAVATTVLPTMLVQPFEQLGSPPPGTYDPALVRLQLIQTLERFDEVTIVTGQAAQATAARTTLAAPSTSVDYQIATTIGYDRDGSMSLTFRFLEAGGTVVWSKTYEHLRPADDGSGLLLPIMAEVSAALLHPFGVLSMQERTKPQAGRPGADRYRCLLDAHEYLRSFAPAMHAKVRACLKQAIAADPNFSAAYVALARLYLREYQFGASEGSEESAPLDRAQELAERAIEINPRSARAYFAMFDVCAARGDADGVRRFGEQALALNPNDPPVVFHYAAQLIMLGDIDKGVAMIRRLMATTTMPPARLDFAMFVASYLKRDFEAAAHYANAMSNDSFMPGLLARVLVSVRTADPVRARKTIERMIQMEPRWRDDPRAELRKFITSPVMVEQFAHELALAGLGPVGRKASENRPEAHGIVQ